jgi:pseudouridine kinase
MAPATSIPAIACIGGIDIDRKARVIDAVRPGSSNPIRVTSCAGGVAGNVARNLAHLGSPVALFSIVGSDPPGDDLLRELRSAGIDVSAMRRSAHRPTASYTAVLDPDGQLFIGLADMEIFEELDPAWADAIAPHLANFALWVVDANLPAPTIERLLNAHKGRSTVLADPISIAKCVRFRNVLSKIDVFFPNRLEAAELTGLTVESRDSVARAAAELFRLGIGTVVVTLGAAGIYFADARAAKFLPAIPPAKIVDVTGAGDALLAGYAFALVSAGADTLRQGTASAVPKSHEDRGALAPEGNRLTSVDIREIDSARMDDPAMFGLAAASVALESDQSVAENLSPELLRRRIESTLAPRTRP